MRAMRANIWCWRAWTKMKIEGTGRSVGDDEGR